MSTTPAPSKIDALPVAGAWVLDAMATIVHDVAELRPADPAGTDTLLVHEDDLRTIIKSVLYAALPAALAPTTPVPAGWKLAPIEPTDEMETAAENDYEQRGETFPDWKHKWRAMLAATPAQQTRSDAVAGAELLLGWTRYEKARKLNPRQWTNLHARNVAGENFDSMIDALPEPATPVPGATP